MEELYGWIRNITYYLIFMTVVSNLLPGKKYEKYLKLFAGMVLILLVLKPVTGGLRLDDRLAYYFEAISFKKEADELKAELSGMEGKRLDNIIGQYEAAVANDIKSMAETAGFVCKKADVTIETEEDSELFGQVKAVFLLLAPDIYEGAEGEMKEPDIDIKKEMEPVERVGQVTVEPVAAGEAESEKLRRDRDRQQQENSKITGLKRRISEYYDLEEQDIEIQLEDGEG